MTNIALHPTATRPPLPLPETYTRGTLSGAAKAFDYFTRRRADLLEAAKVSTELAAVMLAEGDATAAGELLDLARRAVTECKMLDGMGKR